MALIFMIGMIGTQSCPFTVKTAHGIPGSAGVSPAIQDFSYSGRGDRNRPCPFIITAMSAGHLEFH